MAPRLTRVQTHQSAYTAGAKAGSGKRSERHQADHGGERKRFYLLDNLQDALDQVTRRRVAR